MPSIIVTKAPKGKADIYSLFEQLRKPSLSERFATHSCPTSDLAAETTCRNSAPATYFRLVHPNLK
jgi:hypothetical protein